MENLPKPPTLFKCPNCKYIWYSNSQKLYINCPSCKRYFRKEKGFVNVQTNSTEEKNAEINKSGEGKNAEG